MARVLLVNPRICSRRSARIPLSLLSLGAVLEGRHDYHILDGNLLANAGETALAELAREPYDLVGVSVMPGPQVPTAIELSAAIRDAHPSLPIAWGGYFPTMYPEASINARYVDYVVRGAGEETVLELIDRLPDASAPGVLAGIAGLTWKDDGVVRHNAERRFVPPDELPPLPYDRLADLDTYLAPTFMGSRTALHQAAIGCRYRCTFCGVVSMFNGKTLLQGPARLLEAITTLRDRYGATAVQYVDNNFFDSEASSVPLLEAMGKMALPWWCYARADTLAGFSASTWSLIRQSKLRMAYIGAEAASDEVLKKMRKGTRVEQTFEVAARCRENGVIPEFSFVLGGPEDPESEVEKTLAFVKRVKTIHPDCEVILYFYTPTPQRDDTAWRADPTALHLPQQAAYGPDGPPLPTTPEEWCQPKWINFVCHQDAPWLSPKLRQRVQDFAKVLYCRFPTVQDHRTPAWGKAILREMSRWRYRTGKYEHPFELEALRRWIPLKQPQTEGL